MFKSGPPNIETTSTASDDEHENFLLINNNISIFEFTSEG